jgi:MerR family transcriptional regulator, glutamine synthetase repressor
LPNNDSIYPISVVMSMTNLTARQIRYYESHELIKPARSKGNQRLYTPQDVENLLLIKSLLEKGLNLDGINAVISGTQTAEGVSAPTAPTPSTPAVFSPQRPDGPKLTSLYPVNNQEALNNWLQHKRK